MLFKNRRLQVQFVKVNGDPVQTIDPNLLDKVLDRLEEILLTIVGAIIALKTTHFVFSVAYLIIKVKVS